MHFTPYALVPWFGITAIVVICGLALWRGHVEERLAAGALLVGTVVTLAFRDHTWSGLQWSAFAADMGMLVVMVVIALKSSRYWPIWGAGFQLLAVLTHVGRIIDPGVHAWAYATAQVLWSWLLLGSIGVGVQATLADQRDRKTRPA